MGDRLTMGKPSRYVTSQEFRFPNGLFLVLLGETVLLALSLPSADAVVHNSHVLFANLCVVSSNKIVQRFNAVKVIQGASVCLPLFICLCVFMCIHMYSLNSQGYQNIANVINENRIYLFLNPSGDEVSK